MKPLFKIGGMDITVLHVAAVGLLGYFVLKPKAAVAAPRPGMVTTQATPVSVALAVAPAAITAISNFLFPSHYTDTSPDVQAPEGWT